VLSQGNSSDPIDLGTDHIVVIHVAEHEAAKAKPLDQVRDTVRADILQARADQAAKSRADALYAQLQKSGNLESAAKAAGQEVKPATAVARDSGAFDPQLLDAVFRMPRPASGKTTQALAPLSKGRYALVVLDAVHDGDLTSLPKPQRQILGGQMAQVFGAQEIDGLLAALRAHAKIEIANDRLQ
jgi:peptidyl-prolyl cis-trans isomerase D